jgi:glycosyltransferase involved in cell wall biosynthesis
MQKPNSPIGGTELLYNNLAKRVDFSDINLILSICHPDLLSNDKPNVLWQHLNINEENAIGLKDPEYTKRLDAIVFVSHWQHEQFRKSFPLDDVDCYVIQNAIPEFEWKDKPEDKIKLIYTSTPWRGLHVLVEVLKNINRNDIEVDIYSGTSIYGPSFAKQTEGQFEHIYNDISELGYNHIEYAPNEIVREAVQDAHILAYPSVFEETSCLSAIEALSGGCKVVTTNYGALYETCGTWADYVPICNNIVDRYSKILNNAIDTYWDTYNWRKSQYRYYLNHWSWGTRQYEWKQLIHEVTTNG